MNVFYILKSTWKARKSFVHQSICLYNCVWLVTSYWLVGQTYWQDYVGTLFGTFLYDIWSIIKGLWKYNDASTFRRQTDRQIGTNIQRFFKTIVNCDYHLRNVCDEYLVAERSWWKYVDVISCSAYCGLVRQVLELFTPSCTNTSLGTHFLLFHSTHSLLFHLANFLLF